MISLLLHLLALLATVDAPPSLATPAPTTDAEHYLDAIVDKSADPRVDFFQYAVGKWLREHPIPPTERSWGIGRVIQEETYRRLIAINDTAATSHAARGSDAQKIGDFWYSAIDTATIDRQGMKPLAAEFARIDSVRNQKQLLATISHLQYLGVNVMCSPAIFQDEMNSDRYALHLYQGGLGLPDRDYYFDTDERTKNIRREYVIHVRRMFELLGEDSTRAKAHATTVMSLETDLARASRKLEDLRDPHANYHAMSIDDVSKLTPSIRWREFFDHGGIHDVDSVVVGQPEFFQQVEKSLTGRSIADWKTEMRWQLANTFAAEAGGKFDRENFTSTARC
jgi:putative endopeptidase